MSAELVKQSTLKWHLNLPDMRVEYIDTAEGFAKMDWMFLLVQNLQRDLRKFGVSAQKASMSMEDLQKMVENFT